MLSMPVCVCSFAARVCVCVFTKVQSPSYEDVGPGESAGSVPQPSYADIDEHQPGHSAAPDAGKAEMKMEKKARRLLLKKLGREPTQAEVAKKIAALAEKAIAREVVANAVYATQAPEPAAPVASVASSEPSASCANHAGPGTAVAGTGAGAGAGFYGTAAVTSHGKQTRLRAFRLVEKSGRGMFCGRFGTCPLPRGLPQTCSASVNPRLSWEPGGAAAAGHLQHATPDPAGATYDLGEAPQGEHVAAASQPPCLKLDTWREVHARVNRRWCSPLAGGGAGVTGVCLQPHALLERTVRCVRMVKPTVPLRILAGRR